jgi:Tfp pilus assembly protein PilV
MHRLPAQGVRSRLSAEHGVTLIETLISAVILIIVIGAVLTTIDASGRTTTVNKNRSVAAALAEQDQERMRAMSPTALDGHTRSENVDVDGVTYKVDSRSEWIVDASGTTQSCENATGQANYLRISSTVTSSVVGTRVKPVTVRSLVSPRVDSFPENTGTLTVKVTNHLGEPVVGMPVTITPAATGQRNTNEFGCAVFSHIPVGAYTATLDQYGWVNEQRQKHYDTSANVLLNKTTNVAMTYAPEAYIVANFKTGSPAPGTNNSNAHAVTVSNAKSGDLVFNAPGTAAVSSLRAGPLFPYPDGYTAYSGRCALNDPSDASYSPANDAYVATSPGLTNVTPGGPDNVVNVHQPRVNLKVLNSSSAPQVDARVVFTAVESASTKVCGSTAPTAKFERRTDATGFLPDPGLPFGTYSVCVDKWVSGTSYKRSSTFTINNKLPDGDPTLTTVTLPSGNSGGCAT